MYCELKNKEVELKRGPEIKISNRVTKVFKICSGDYIELAGKKVHIQCDMDQDERCLQNKF